MDPNPYSHTALKPSDAAAAADGRVPSPHSFALSGKIMLSAIVILFSIVLFILFLHFYVRWHVLRRARSRRRRFVFSGGDHSSSPNRAIDPSILKSLPVLLFSPASTDDAELDECDCAVCLNEFEDGEKIRHLPLCGHSFHVDCIDMWFASHSNCPLCRAAVEAAPPSGQEVIGSSSSDSGEGEVAIDVPEGGVEGFSEETEALGLGQFLKWPINRVVLFRRFLSLDIGPDRNGVSGAAADLENGEGTPPPPPPPADL